MMKKRTISLLLVICILASSLITAGAVEPRASVYFSSHSATLFADGSGRMSVDVLIQGLKVMNKIGVKSLKIEEKYTENGTWHPYDTLYGTSDPDTLYSYGVRTCLKTFHFDGTPGYYYRVTATVYADDSEGSDTKTTPSTAVRCK